MAHAEPAVIATRPDRFGGAAVLRARQTFGVDRLRRTSTSTDPRQPARRSPELAVQTLQTYHEKTSNIAPAGPPIFGYKPATCPQDDDEDSDKDSDAETDHDSSQLIKIRTSTMRMDSMLKHALGKSRK